MLTRKAFTYTVALAASVAVAACDDSTVPNTPLTDAQVDELMQALTSTGFVPATPVAAARGSAAISLNVDRTVDCPVSGSVHVIGSWSVNDALNSFTANVRATHQACAATSQKTGKTWTFDGKPDVAANVSVSVTNVDTGAGTLSGSEKGAIAFSTEGLEGTCQIDLSISATTNDAGVATGTLSGTVCGKDVSQELPNAT